MSVIKVDYGEIGGGEFNIESVMAMSSGQIETFEIETFETDNAFVYLQRASALYSGDQVAYVQNGILTHIFDYGAVVGMNLGKVEYENGTLKVTCGSQSQNLYVAYI